MRYLRSSRSENSIYSMKMWRFKPYKYRGKLTLEEDTKSQDGERPAILHKRKHKEES